MLVRITQQDVVYRRYLVPEHRSFVPDFGVYIKVQGSNGDVEYRSLSRQLVLFCVERRKAWRMLQSKAGIEIEFGDYQCPICRLFWKERCPLPGRNIDTGKVKPVFRDFPLPVHPMQVLRDDATECAEDQGLFWECPLSTATDRRAREGEVAEFRANDQSGGPRTSSSILRHSTLSRLGKMYSRKSL